MSSNQLRDVREFTERSSGARLGAIAASVIASLCLALLFPLLYLCVDLLVTRGTIPASVPAEVRVLLGERFGVTLNSTGTEHGFLSLVAREHDRWYGPFLNNLARVAPWTWRSDSPIGPNPAYLATICVAAALLIVLRCGLLNLASYWATAASLETGMRLRRAIYTHGQRLSAVAIRPDAQAEAGELVSQSVDEIQDGVHTDLTVGVRAPVIAAVAFVTLISSHVLVAASVVALGGLVWLAAGSMAAWFRRDARLADRRVTARLGMIRESMTGLQLAKCYLMERFSQTRFERHLSDLTKSIWRRQRGETISRPTLAAIVSLAAVAAVFLAGRVVLAGEMSVANVALKAAALTTLVLALGRWLAGRFRIRRAAGAAADVFEFLDRRGDTGQAVDAEFLQPLSRQLELADVSVREPGTGRMLLERVSLTIPAGQNVAVLAADPAELHAVAHLLTRFTDPTAGEVRIDGKNTRWVTYESVRTQVAVVLENSLTFSDTVLNNIGCGDPIYTLPQIIAAAKLAHVHQFVQRLPYGYETRIGTAGMMLSTGEQFRIALARALLRDPSLLIVEEPAGLDTDSLVLIDDTLTRAKTGRTLLFLARRPSTVRAADRVYVLRNGRLAAAGSHDELLESSELYRQLHLKHALAAGDTP